MAHLQFALPFNAIRNHGLFSNHWLEIRLPLEPEWTDLRDDAVEPLRKLTDLWRAQRTRIEQCGEQALEQAFHSASASIARLAADATEGRRTRLSAPRHRHPGGPDLFPWPFFASRAIR